MSRGPAARPSLPPPAVAPELYDEEYYRTACAGYLEWGPSDGAQLAPAYHFYFERLGIAPGQTLVDIGAGRGELLVVADRAGVSALGVEYSDAAVRLARHTLDRHQVTNAQIVLADARALPVEDSSADAATLLDVVEHLTPGELDTALAEARRILKPGAPLLIHTFPNRTIYEVTYRLQRLAAPWRLRTWPADPRMHWERSMHVNEQTVRRLGRALRRHFRDVDVQPGAWIHTKPVPSERAARTYHRLAKLPAPLDRLGKADIWAEARA